MLLHTYVYLIDKEEGEADLGIPHDHDEDEIASAVIRVEWIEFAYPLDEEHTQVVTTSDRIKIKTKFADVVEAMESIV